MSNPETLLSPNPETATQHILATALDVQRVVRSQLRFEKGHDVDDAIQTGVANCVGYAYIGSEKLEAAGIDHRVALINEHATLLIPTPEGTWLWNIDGMKVSIPIDHAVLPFKPTMRDRELWRLNGAKILDAAELESSSEESKYGWLRADNERVVEYIGQRHQTRDINLIASVFEPETGRAALYQYGRFLKAYNQGDLQTASDALISAGHLFPDVDMRNRVPHRVKSIVKRLAIAGHIEQAEAATNAYFSALEWSRDSRVIEFKADCLRYIAQYSGKQTLACRAISLYLQASRRPNAFSKSLSAKVALCDQISQVDPLKQVV